MRGRLSLAGAGGLILLLTALGLVARLGGPLPTAKAPAHPAQGSPAHQRYLEGQYLQALDELDQAKGSFEEAAILDPGLRMSSPPSARCCWEPGGRRARS